MQLRSSSWSGQNRAATCGWSRHSPGAATLYRELPGTRQIASEATWTRNPRFRCYTYMYLGYALRLASFPGLPQFILHIDVEEWLVETERPGIIHHMIDVDQVDVWGPTTNEFTTGWGTCVDCLGVSTNCGAFEPSQLDDELLQDLLKRLQAPLFLHPPHINLTTLMWWTPGLPRSLLLFRIRVLLSMQTDEKKTG